MTENQENKRANDSKLKAEYSQKQNKFQKGVSSQIHDFIVKRLLLKTFILREFIKIILPKKLTSVLDLDTLQIEKSDIIGDSESRADFACTINFKDLDHKAYILLFFEHLSAYSPNIMLRLLKYHTGFYWQKHKERKDCLALSVVISQGVSGQEWTSPVTFQEYLQKKGVLPKEYMDILKEHIVNFKTYVFDIQKVNVSQANPILRPILYSLKHINNLHSNKPIDTHKEFLQSFYRLVMESSKQMATSKEIELIFEDLKKVSKDFAGKKKDAIIENILIDEIEDLSLYFMQYNPSITEDFLRQLFKQVSVEEGGKDYMEALDYTREGAKLKGIEIGRQEGIEKGRQEGIEKGRQEGIEKGRRAIALKLLQTNMDIKQVSTLTELSELELCQLQAKP